MTNVKRFIEYYRKKLGFNLELDASPHFAMLRVGKSQGGTIGLLSWTEARKDGAKKMSAAQKRAVHVELSMTAFDPDGYSVEFAQGRRGKNAKK